MSTSLRTFIVNGVTRRVAVADEQTLADLLHDELGLTGCKVGCDQGVCGACTVLVDLVPIAACSSFAFTVEGTQILTIEGLAPRGGLDPVQQAFLDAGAVQCGFCTAGLILSTHALLRRHPAPGDATITAWLDGHVCRCTGYASIVAAIRLAASRLPVHA